MIPINKIVSLVSDLYPKIEQFIPVRNGDLIKEIIDSHAKEVVLQITQKTWLERHWLTILMVLLFLIITINYLLIPIINIYHPIQSIPLPSELWTFIEVIIPTTLGFRSLDKHAPSMIEKIGNKQKSE